MNLTVQLPQKNIRVRFDKPMTDERLMKFCARNELVRVEREPNGDLMLMSPSGTGGGWVEGKVFGELYIWTNADGRGTHLGPNSGFTLPDTSMRAADASWISWHRFNSLSDKQLESFAPVCPEFVIEVRSPSDRLKSLQSKMQMWIDNGAELAWLIDPKRKVIEIYRPGESPEIHENPTSVYGSGPVQGFELVLSRIWG